MPDTVHLDVTVAELADRPIARAVTVQSENITTQLLTEVNRLRTDPCYGGDLTFPSGDFVIDQPLGTLDNNKGGIDIGGKATRLTYAGTAPGWMLEVECSTGGSGYKPRAKVHDLTVFNTNPNAAGCLLLEDTQGNKVRDCNIRDFPVGVRIWNAQSWSELNDIQDCGFTCDTAIDFRPGDVEGLGGTQSFARTYICNLILSGGQPGQALINLDGGFYECVIEHVGGNLTSGGVEVLRINSGNYGGTLLSGRWGFETTDGGGGGSCLFRKMTDMTGTMPVFDGHARASAGNFVYYQDAPFLWSPRLIDTSLALMHLPSVPSAEANRAKVYGKNHATTPGAFEKRSNNVEAKL